MVVDGRRLRPIAALPLANKLRMRKGLPPDDVARVATDLLVTAALLERRFRNELRNSPYNDLDVARLLLVLGSHSAPLRPIDLVELLAVSSATVTRILDRAEAAGLVDRSYVSVDRRVTLCLMSRKGEQARADLLDRLRVAASPLLDAHAVGLTEGLASARATWRRRAAGQGIRLIRDAKLAYDLTA
jgi:DNA-binding MarR family transcriptional regulator